MITYYDSGYRTRRFCDIIDSEQIFIQLYNDITENFITIDKLKNPNNSTIKSIYYLLYARYGDSHIAADNENQFLYALMSTIIMYGPSWERKLEIQKSLRQLTDDEINKGTSIIFNHANNPGSEPSTDSLNSLKYIDEQTTNTYKKGKVEGYATLWEILKTDITNDFIKKFEKLFIVVAATDEPLLYKERKDG